MSEYENYSRTSANYDQTRQVIGLEILLGCFALGQRPLNQLNILDAGCGTGSYSKALLPYVRHVKAIDLNPGMLRQAADKLEEEIRDGKLSLHRGEIENLPFDDQTFDGVMINQVLHHLPDDATAGFPRHQRVLEEFSRLLKPGGTLVVNTCTQEQLLYGCWYYSLIPDAAEKARNRYSAVDFLIEKIKDHNFRYSGSFTPTNAVVQGEAYYDPQGPLSQSWRDGDSVWALATEEELHKALQSVRRMEEQNTLRHYMQEQDKHRTQIGQITFLHAVKE